MDLARLTHLGLSAEARGHHAAGVATFSAGHWRRRRGVGPFRDLLASHGQDDLFAGDVVLGHTRWATQGGRTVAQASPLRCGPLLGTHNGDLDVDSIPHRFTVAGETDSEVLFRALLTAHRQRASAVGIAEILSTVRGRAAAVWTDTRLQRPRVWIARAGLSPLAVAIDAEGSLWWASSPSWLRAVNRHWVRPPRLIGEGTLLSAVARQRMVAVTTHPAFRPTVRATDAWYTRAVWRGIEPAEAARDREDLRHDVAGLDAVGGVA